MIKITKIFTRPSTDIPWHSTTGQIKEKFTELNETMPGGSMTRTESADGLRMTVIRLFKDAKAHNEFLSDDIFAEGRLNRLQYCQDVGIDEYPALFEEFDEQDLVSN